MTVLDLRSPATRRPHGAPAPVRRVAMLSVHTSPLDQPGTGDAGGLNVYVVETARRLAELGTEVEVFTRSTSSDLPPVVEAAPGVTVRHVVAGPYEGLSKHDLVAQLCALTSGVLRAEAAHDPGHYDLIHSHYWLSGQVGWLAAERWRVPLVHSMHTMAKVKNAALADGDAPEPALRVIGEQQVVDAADRLVANTVDEGRQLVELYDADPDRVDVVHPGVDLAAFRPGDRAAARAALHLPPDALVVLFAGRIQPLKGPDVLLRAVAELVARTPELRHRLVLAVVGGPSGTGLDRPEHLARLAAELGIADLLRLAPPAARAELACWYRAADLTAVPSYNESFGLVAVESQACGTLVVAAEVGGLRTAVRDGWSGLLVPGHDPQRWAAALDGLLRDPLRRQRMGLAARHHAAGFGWERTARRTLEVYRAARAASSAAAAPRAAAAATA